MTKIPKPVKLEVHGYDHECGNSIFCGGCRDEGYNQAVKNYEEWLQSAVMSKQQIADIIRDNMFLKDVTCNQGRIFLACVIHKELMKQLEVK